MLAAILAVCWLGVSQSLAFPTVHVKRNITVLGDVRNRTVALRVLPLGDSITNGVGSSDNNGYRDIFVELAEQGGPVEMIGSHNGSGIMPDNEEEGWNGYTIDQISQKATNALKAAPNLVLLLAGTNNMYNASQAASAPAEMGNLIDKVLAGSSRAVLIVGTIIPSTLAGRQVLNNQYNAALQQMVTDRQNAGKHILLAPIASAVEPSQLVDGIHPNSAGYQQMAVVWIQSVNDAQDRGWFESPQPGDGYVAPSSNDSRAAVGMRWWHYLLISAILAFTTTPHIRLES